MLPSDTERAAGGRSGASPPARASRRTAGAAPGSPMIEVLGSEQLARTGEEAHYDLVPQFQVTLNTRQHIMANFGVRIPLDKPGTRSTQICVLPALGLVRRRPA
ncbi:MAG: hypothetical protein MZV64_43260 [Ignavibacteriales bacterium]|nr:hypothetical protein [Ignavibacteriales bacterium]